MKSSKVLHSSLQRLLFPIKSTVIEQDHRHSKRIVKPMMGLKTFNSARRTLSGIEAMNMIRKAQVKGVDQGDSVSAVKFIEAIFGIAD
ncbi:DDE-type integrase/transposase/recombinase [Phormidium tenue FACHB-886]|nr:DDE-type integrase/transposase/recombinase [Phormidium tenue FACHB-886]